MNYYIRRAALLAAVGLPAVLGAQAASAALITTWNYQIDSTFLNFTETGGVAGSEVTASGGNAVLGGDTEYSWGIPVNGPDQSAVSITSDVDGVGLLTGGPSVGGATFTHDNNVITGGSSELSTFDLQTRLNLVGTAEDAPGGSLPADEIVGPITFDSFFTETANTTPCLPTSGSVCDDIFVLSNAGQIGALGSGQSFIIDDYKYTVFLDLAGLGTLTDAECAEAGAASGCVGLTTEENTPNTFNTSLQIVAQEVPAPGILALFGIGLMGLGFAAKHRNDKA
jgi:hypothetical protein